MPNPIGGRRKTRKWVDGNRDYGLTTSEHKILLKLNGLTLNLVVNDTERGIEEYGLADGILPIQSMILSASAIKNISVNLSRMTEEELVAMRQFFNDAIDSALPASRELQKNAEENNGKGNKYYPRLYRQVPVYSDRRGPEQEYRESVLRRPGPDSADADDGDGG